MQCEKFEELWQATLDARQVPDEQPELVAHAGACPACASLLSASESLFDGLDGRLVPPTPAELEDRVLAELSQRPGRFHRVWGWSGYLAIAAAVLVAVTLALRTGGSDAPSDDPDQVAVNEQGKSPADSQPSHVADTKPDIGPSVVPVVLPSVDDEYLAMVRRTGLAVALLPQQVRRVTETPEGALVADHLRPIAEPFGAALDALRRTVPGMSSELSSLPDAKSSSHAHGADVPLV